MNTTTMLFLRSNPAMYVCASRRSKPRPYVHIRGRIFFLAPWPLYVRVHATCAPLLRHVHAYTTTSMYVHVRDQNDNAIYASTRWVPTVRHFLACEDVAGGSQQSGANVFFAKYDGPSDGSPLSGGGIIILHVIRRHFLAAAVDPAVSLSMYSPRPMEAVP